jgi:DNA replicative helicase MCM subunit Mcm2 (Cdc46/Mcm family)
MRQWVANIDLEIAVSLINHTLVEFDEDKNDQKLDVRYLISFQRQRNERLTEEIFDRYKKEMKNKAK